MFRQIGVNSLCGHRFMSLLSVPASWSVLLQDPILFILCLPWPCCSLSSGLFNPPSIHCGPHLHFVLENRHTCHWTELGGNSSSTPSAMWSWTSHFLFLRLGFHVSEYVLYRAGFHPTNMLKNICIYWALIIYSAFFFFCIYGVKSWTYHSFTPYDNSTKQDSYSQCVIEGTVLKSVQDLSKVT